MCAKLEENRSGSFGKQSERKYFRDFIIQTLFTSDILKRTVNCLCRDQMK